MKTIKKLVVKGLVAGLFNGRGRRTCLRTLRVAFGNVPSEAKLLRCMLSQMLVLLVAAGLCGTAWAATGV